MFLNTRIFLKLKNVLSGVSELHTFFERRRKIYILDKIYNDTDSTINFFQTLWKNKKIFLYLTKPSWNYHYRFLKILIFMIIEIILRITKHNFEFAKCKKHYNLSTGQKLCSSFWILCKKTFTELFRNNDVFAFILYNISYNSKDIFIWFSTCKLIAFVCKSFNANISHQFFLQNIL